MAQLVPEVKGPQGTRKTQVPCLRALSAGLAEIGLPANRRTPVAAKTSVIAHRPTRCLVRLRAGSTRPLSVRRRAKSFFDGPFRAVAVATAVPVHDAAASSGMPVASRRPAP